MLISAPAELWGQLTDTTGVAEGLRGAPRAYNYDARTTALGDATVADATYLSSYNMNPAALSFVSNLNIIQINSYQAWRNNQMQQTLSLPAFSYGSHRLAPQVGVAHRGVNSLNYLGSSEIIEPEMDMVHIDLVYAYSFQNVLSIGMMNSWAYTQNENRDFWTYFATLGVLYAPSESVSYGISFRGLGHSPTYRIITEDGDEEAGDEGLRDTELTYQNLRESLELGATLKFPAYRDDPYMSLSLANEKRFGEDGIWYKVGFEFKPLPTLALRSGILFQPALDIYTPRFGAGFDGDFLKLDYSVSYKDQLFERFHQLGLTIYFDRL